MITQYEKNICNELAKFISIRKNQEYAIKGFPEEEKSGVIDAWGMSGSSKFFIEHTLLEGYCGEIADIIKSSNFSENIKNDLESALPGIGHWALGIPIRSFEEIKSQYDWNPLIEWVREKSRILYARKSSGYFREVLKGLSFEVRLSYFHNSGYQGFDITREISDLEEEAKLRVRKALNDKCPKLKIAKGSISTSILALELRGRELGNPIKIREFIVNELSQRRDDIPDEIYLVETRSNPWRMWIVKEGVKLFSDIVDHSPFFSCPLPCDN